MPIKIKIWSKTWLLYKKQAPYLRFATIPWKWYVIYKKTWWSINKTWFFVDNWTKEVKGFIETSDGKTKFEKIKSWKDFRTMFEIKLNWNYNFLKKIWLKGFFWREIKEDKGFDEKYLL